MDEPGRVGLRPRGAISGPLSTNLLTWHTAPVNEEEVSVENLVPLTLVARGDRCKSSGPRLRIVCLHFLMHYGGSEFRILLYEVYISIEHYPVDSSARQLLRPLPRTSVHGIGR